MKRVNYELARKYLSAALEDKYTYQDIKNRFEAVDAPKYGSDMSAWIPDLDYANQLLLESIATQVAGRRHFVELGAGTGRVSRMLLAAFPQTKLTLVDISANMLAEAARQLGELADRCEFLVRDLFDADLHFDRESIDCVASVFAICHGQGEQNYADLYSQIHSWLRPGGYFVCYDHVAGDSTGLTVLNALGWARLLERTQDDAQVREAVVSTYQEDSPLSLRRHMELLGKAGFAVADVLYKRDIFAIYAAVK